MRQICPAVSEIIPLLGKWLQCISACAGRNVAVTDMRPIPDKSGVMQRVP